MTYVLIILVSVYRGGGAATAEFGSLEACENARRIIGEMAAESYMTTRAVTRCIPKSTDTGVPN